MNASQLKDFRNRLFLELAAAAECVRRDRSLAEEVEQLLVIPEEGEMATRNHSRAVINAVAESHAFRLKSIEQAIERIDRGEYGSCSRCEGDIHLERLVAMPWATLCLECQTQLEHADSARFEHVLTRLDDEGICDDRLHA